MNQKDNREEEQLINDINAEQMLMDQVLPESPPKSSRNNNDQFSEPRMNNISASDNRFRRGISDEPDDNGQSQSMSQSVAQKAISIHQMDDDSLDFEHEGAGPSMHGGSFIPKPSQQLQVDQPSFNESVHGESKNFFGAPRGASIGAEARGSPPKTMIGSGIGQGFQRGLTMRPVTPGHPQAQSSNNVPVSQINLNSSQLPSLTPQQQSSMDHPLRRQSTQHPGLAQSLSQKRIKKSTSPKTKDGNKFKSSSRSKSFKKNAMFSSVASAHVQNRNTDDREFSTQRKTREERDKAYKSLTKDLDSDLGDSGSRGSSLSNNGNRSQIKGSSHLFENKESQQDNVKVCIRVRPLNQREQHSAQGRAKCVQVDQGTIFLERGFDTKKFNFDFVGNEQIDQATIFKHIAKPIADSCMQGYNGTIFAYGQTGAGKTHTIQGPILDVEGVDMNDHEQMTLAQARASKSMKENAGIIQRSFEYIFQNIHAQQQLVQENADGSELNYLIKCSYLEIYNEQIMDLLDPSSINLNVREDIKKGVYVEGLKEEIITSYRDMLQLTLRGVKNRHVGSTSMNRESSRSHSVLTTIIESKSLSQTGVWNMKTSRFHIIDLAGSERSKNTNAMGERLKEAGMINKSLSALGNVINSLVEHSEGKGRHIPYRDSKLTFMLRDSLGGNSKTVIIANISPSAVNMGETLSTLEFAKRAKQIKNKAVVNEDSSGTILILKNEIKRLKKDLTEQYKRNQQLTELQQQATEQVPASFICQKCKMNVIMEEMGGQDEVVEEELEDSLLIEDLNKSGADQNESAENGDGGLRMSREVRMSKEFKIGAADQYKKMKVCLDQQVEKTKQAENLLALNLQNLTAQQRYYESELKQLQEQHQAQTTAFEALTQQQNRDKMKLKLREDKIAKLEAEHSIIMSEECINLQTELKMLQEQLEKEREDVTNPKLTALKAQLVETQLSLRKLQKETPGAPPQLQQLFQDQTKMIDDLSSYLKNKASIEAIEQNDKQLQKLAVENGDLKANDAKLTEQLNDLQKQYDILLEQNVKAEEVNQRITREYGKANVEIRDLEDRLEKVKNELEKEAKDKVQDQQEHLCTIECFENQIEELQKEIDSKNKLVENMQKNLTETQLQLSEKVALLSLKDQELDDFQDKMTQQITSKQNLQVILQSNQEESSKKYENLLSEFEHIKNEASLLKGQLERHTQSNDEKDQDLARKDDQLMENSNQICSLQKELAQKDGDLKQKLEDLETLKKAHETLTQSSTLQIQSLNEQLTQVQDDILQLTTNIQEKESYNQQQTDKLNGQLQEKIKLLETLNGEHHVTNDALKQAQEELKAISDELNATKGELSNAQIDLSETKEQYQNTQIELDNQKEHLKQLMEDHQQLLNDHEGVMKDQNLLLQEYDAVKLERESLLQKHSCDSQTHLSRQEELTKQVAEQKARADQLTTEAEEKEIEIQQQKQSHAEEMKQKQDEFDSQIKQMQTVQQETMSAQIKSMEDKVRQLQEQAKGEVDDKDQHIESLESQVSNLQGAKEGLEKEIEGNKKDIQALSDEKTGLSSQLQEGQAQLAETQATLKEAQDALKQNQESLKETKDTLKKTEETLEKTEEALNDRVAQFKDMEIKLKDAESQLNDAEGSLKQAEVAKKELETSLNDTKESLKDAEAEMKNSKDELQAKQNELSAKEDELSAKEAQNMSQAETITSLEADKASLTDECKRVTEMVMDFEKKQAELETQNKAYQSNISYLDVSVEQMQSTLQQKASDYDRVLAESQELGAQIEDQKTKNEALNEELVACKELLKEKCEVTQGQDQENAETQVLLLEAHDLIQKKETTITELTTSLDTAESQLTELRQKNDEQHELIEQKDKQMELVNLEHEEKVKDLEAELEQQKAVLQKLEVEKDNLQFKRDEATKALEQKIKDLKKINEEVVADATNHEQRIIDFTAKVAEAASQNKGLEDQLVKVKQEAESQLQAEVGELTKKLQTEQKESSQALAKSTQEKDELSRMLEEKTNKETSLLQEVTEMQNYIDNLTDQLNKSKQFAREVDLIKQDCYKRIASIQEKQVACLQNNTDNVDAQKQKIKDSVAQALAEIADVSQYNSSENGASERQVEVSLLVSQIVCEFSKLYENQIVLEKKKASQDYKKYSDKCEKQKNEIKTLQEEKSKVNGLIAKGKEKDVEAKQLREQIDRLKQEFEAQVAEKIEAHDRAQAVDQANQENEKLQKKVEDLEGTQQTNSKTIEEQKAEMMELKDNMQQYQKQIYEQKQLYEVRVQSQEQEIEQHQFRYRELERKVQADIQKQESKFAQVQEQVHILAQSTKQAQADKEALLRQIQDMQGSVEQVQLNDEQQRNQLNKYSQSNQLLQKQVQQRESEMAEVVQSLKQFAEANRQLEAQLNVLRTENEQLAGGHRNPNQKIQFHMKIKEENNRLRADNFRLQEDLQRKIETIYKQQQNIQLFESTARTLKGAVSSASDAKAETKLQRDYNALVQHIISCPQFSRLARAGGVKFDPQSGSQSLQKIMELISSADDALEQPQALPSEIYASPDHQSNSQGRSNGVKGMPPRPAGGSNQLAQSKSSQNLAPVPQNQPQPGYSRTTTTAGPGQVRGTSQKNVPLASSAKKKLASSGGTRKGSDIGRDSKLDPQQAQFKQSQSNQRLPKQTSHATLQPGAPSPTMQGNNTSRQMLQQQLNNFNQMGGSQDPNAVTQRQRGTSGSASQQEPATLTQGSPVMINSYSSLYKQAQQQQMAQLAQQQRIDKDQGSQHRLHPQNSPFAVQSHAQSDCEQKMLQHNQVPQQMMPPDQQYQQQQQMLANSNYSSLSSKHKQYKQAQSQKSAHLGSQRSKSRQGAPGLMGGPVAQEPNQMQKMVNPDYPQFTAGSLDGQQQDPYRH